MIKNIKLSLSIIIVIIINLLITPHKSLGIVSNLPSLTLSSENVKEGAAVTAILKDSKGNPIPDAPIYFSTITTFGPLKLKSLPTDENGAATLLIPINERQGDFIVEANFKGDEKYSPIFTKANISFNKTKLNENSYLRLPLPIFIPFSQLMNILIPKSSDILLYSGENRGLTFNEIPQGSSITPYPSIELATILFIIFFTIWSIYFYVVNQILQIKKISPTSDSKN